ncbi:hypothetical protein FMM01_09180 [Schleiferilactobacillus harbinensis]|uniref:GDSL-type esterase/lipase family protein n=1 Tax=Schleiferilactobacillus harbinensis TaxID=304207 RepID=UPI00123C440B|nr:SGNH/GDSL hydrolase family protein [Schleiferilactobacillus harbinensis]QEU47455.1 hypothetical protein FMM01_09180 [Schleiferilactobacillus harbinensis]
MAIITVWRQEFSDYRHIHNINATEEQTVRIYMPWPGHSVRFQLTAEFDEVPIHVRAMSVSRGDDMPLPVTVGGQDRFDVLPRLTRWTDWVDLNLAGGEWLTIYIHATNHTIRTLGSVSATNLIDPGQAEADERFFGVNAVQAAVDVDQPVRRLVFFGDSLTNMSRFSAPLARKLVKRGIVTANHGISGNRLLYPGHGLSPWVHSFGEAGIRRIDHLLVTEPPAMLLFMEGLNDLLHPGTESPARELPSAAGLNQGIDAVAAKCADRHVTFIPMTITPFGQSQLSGIEAWSPEKEKIRQAVNDHIRSFPYAIDLASQVASTADSSVLDAVYDCGDHIHFSVPGGREAAKFLYADLRKQKLV